MPLPSEGADMNVGGLRLRNRPGVRIQKPEVAYDLGKFSVTNSARLPNYFERNTLYIFYTLKKFLLSNIAFPLQ
jgi:hypothetical protein